MLREAFRANWLDMPKRTVLTSLIQLQIGILATERFLVDHSGFASAFQRKRFGI